MADYINETKYFASFYETFSEYGKVFDIIHLS